MLLKRILQVALLAVVLSPVTVFAKKNDAALVPDYQMTGAGMTSDNAHQVVISVISKKKDNVTLDDLERAAVHGLLFRDYDDATNSAVGQSVSHKAIMSSPTDEQKYIDFFEPFFRNGDYKKYVQIVSNSRRVVKVGKEWKVSAVVRVNTAALKSVLKKQNMIKNLGSGW